MSNLQVNDALGAVKYHKKNRMSIKSLQTKFCKHWTKEPFLGVNLGAAVQQVNQNRLQHENRIAASMSGY